MTHAPMSLDAAAAVVHRLCAAVNAHALDDIVSCFAVDYQNTTPVHPARGFVGREQVRQNWMQILGAVPDVAATIIDYSVNGARVWSEWEHRGTRRDGTPHLMRGVVIFTVLEHLITRATFYLEPVDTKASDINAAIRQQVLLSEPS